MKRAALNAKFQKRCALFPRSDEQHIEVSGRPSQSVQLRHHESSQEIQASFFPRFAVEFGEERVPRFRNVARAWHAGDSPPSCPSTDSNALLLRGGLSEAISSPLPSGHRGKEYLPSQAASVPERPHIPLTCRNGEAQRTWRRVGQPKLRQIPAGSAGPATWRSAPSNPNPCSCRRVPAMANLPLPWSRGSRHSARSAELPRDCAAPSTAGERTPDNPALRAACSVFHFPRAFRELADAAEAPSGLHEELLPPGVPGQQASSGGRFPAWK